MKKASYEQIGTDNVTTEIVVDDYNEAGEIIGQHTETVTKEVPVMGVVYRDMTTDEIADMEREAEESAEYERTRPMTTDERLDMLDECIAELSTLMSDMMEV